MSPVCTVLVLISSATFPDVVLYKPNRLLPGLATEPVSVSVICVLTAVIPKRGNVAAFSPEIQPDSPLPASCRKLDIVLSGHAFARADRSSALPEVSLTVKANAPTALLATLPSVLIPKRTELVAFSTMKGRAV